MVLIAKILLLKIHLLLYKCVAMPRSWQLLAIYILYFLYKMHMFRQSLSLKYVFVNGFIRVLVFFFFFNFSSGLAWQMSAWLGPLGFGLKCASV